MRTGRMPGRQSRGHRRNRVHILLSSLPVIKTLRRPGQANLLLSSKPCDNLVQRIIWRRTITQPVDDNCWRSAHADRGTKTSPSFNSLQTRRIGSATSKRHCIGNTGLICKGCPGLQAERILLGEEEIMHGGKLIHSCGAFSHSCRRTRKPVRWYRVVKEHH